ncbi:isochorismatase family protein [Spirosoma sp. HMF4905]|uniref:Isochorismatase family protein n=1 Tax=Spirosoma arboris TaxID=2682092 RepID=A0A7K1SF84_9BACT|nr:isochorismatase family cysteine hydrolase [Spirosoma arboris]MVM32477.1 isochorismatase family protein [Spirosoma arboris]
MEKQNTNLHGNAPDNCPIALLIIDMINDLEFPEGDLFVVAATSAAEKIARLKQQAKCLHIPVIYINDNFGRWRSDLKEVVNHCLTDQVRGQRLAELLLPEPDDYFVLKPKHSAFYETTLATLLGYLQVKHVILTGLSADACILFSAIDAYMRELIVSVPADCVASASEEHTQTALVYMKRMLKADITSSPQMNLEALLTDRYVE